MNAVRCDRDHMLWGRVRRSVLGGSHGDGRSGGGGGDDGQKRSTTTERVDRVTESVKMCEGFAKEKNSLKNASRWGAEGVLGKSR